MPACYLGYEMRRVTKSFVDEAAHAWGPWAPVRFQTMGARDEFLVSVAAKADSAWTVQAMTEDGRGAQARWLRGSFLRLNDVAYAHGGRIIVQVMHPRTY